MGRRPSALDAFADELEHLARKYEFRHDASDQPSGGELREWLASSVNVVRKGDKFTRPADEDPDYLTREISAVVCDPNDISKARHAIEMMLEGAAALKRILPDKSYRRGRIGAQSPEHWLIGEALPKVYTRHFAEKFGMSRDKATGKPSGPGVRFIVEVLSIMGVCTRDGKPFTPEAIEYYIRRPRL